MVQTRRIIAVINLITALPANHPTTIQLLHRPRTRSTIRALDTKIRLPGNKTHLSSGFRHEHWPKIPRRKSKLEYHCWLDFRLPLSPHSAPSARQRGGAHPHYLCLYIPLCRPTLFCNRVLFFNWQPPFTEPEERSKWKIYLRNYGCRLLYYHICSRRHIYQMIEVEGAC
jgi:hypothetical protein